MKYQPKKSKKQSSSIPTSEAHEEQTILARSKKILSSYDFVILFIVLFFAYNTVPGVALVSGDVAPASCLPVVLVIQHTVFFDQAPFSISTPEVSYAFPYVNGHFVSLFPIVTPVLVTPIYAVSIALVKILSAPFDYMQLFILAKSSSSVIAALAGVLVYLTARQLFSKNVAVLTTFIFAFATTTWSISSQALWQHGTVELLLIAMIYLIVLNERFRNSAYILILGILSGLFIFNRPPDSVLLIPVIAYILWRERSSIHYWLIGGLIAGLPFLYYNYSIFGNVFGGYAQNLPLFSFTPLFVINYVGLLIAPNVGLFIFCPVLILAIAGFYYLTKTEDSTLKNLFLLFGPVVLLQILVYSFFTEWYSAAAYCYGPRFLTGFIPVLCLFIGYFLEYWYGKTPQPMDKKKKVISFVIVCLIISSVFLQFIGVFLYDISSRANETVDQTRVWNWSDTIIGNSYVQGPPNMKGIHTYTLPPFPPLLNYEFPNATATGSR